MQQVFPHGFLVVLYFLLWVNFRAPLVAFALPSLMPLPTPPSAATLPLLSILSIFVPPTPSPFLLVLVLLQVLSLATLLFDAPLLVFQLPQPLSSATPLLLFELLPTHP